jgi:phosphohistidine phosphatase SixA
VKYNRTINIFAVTTKLTARRDHMRTVPIIQNRALLKSNCLIVLAIYILYLPALNAQTVSANSQTAKASAIVVPAPSNAVEEAPFGLADGLVRELRNGGYVLYVKHGAVLPSTIDRIGAGERWKDCRNTKRIGPDTQVQMRVIAEALSRQRISVYEVLSSEFCRAHDTAVLLGVAVPERIAALNEFSTLNNLPQPTAALPIYTAGIQQLLSKPIPPKTNRALVGHALPPNIVNPALSALPDSHTAIFKVEPGNRFHYITTLSPGQWQSIGKQAVIDLVPVAAQAPQVAAPTAAPNVALIDPAKEFKGAALLQALRKGGFNLYMRHAIANVGQDGNLTQTPQWWDNCTIQRNIADTGRDQARKLGAALRELKIPISQVLTAQFCRTRDTGHEMDLGPIEITEDLNHLIAQRAGFDVNAARFRQLAELPPKGTNRVLVSHTHGSPKTQERIMASLQEAEIVVFQPDGKGSTEPIARIPLLEWENLLKLATASSP